MTKIFVTPKGFLLICETEKEAHQAMMMKTDLEAATGATWAVLGGAQEASMNEVAAALLVNEFKKAAARTKRKRK